MRPSARRQRIVFGCTLSSAAASLILRTRPVSSAMARPAGPDAVIPWHREQHGPERTERIAHPHTRQQSFSGSLRECASRHPRCAPKDTKSVVEGRSVFVPVDFGGRRVLKKKQQRNKN